MILPNDLVDSIIFKIKQVVTNTVPTIKLIKNVESCVNNIITINSY